MKGKDFIQAKQQSWARRKGFELVPGTIGSNGEKNYVNDFNQNLFTPLTKENIACFEHGDGQEMQGRGQELPKMKALQSSSVLAVNLFQYWQEAPLEILLEALKLPTKKHIGTTIKNIGSKTDCTIVETSKRLSFDNIKFEEQFEISPDKSRFPRKANIDVVIHGDYDFAIESKFIEPYRDKPKALKTAYIEDESLWNGLPHLYKLAKKISPDNDIFRYLDAAQLIKHTLGLKNTYCVQEKKEEELNCTPSNEKEIRTLKITSKPHEFYLIYLWYDVPGEDGFRHRKEIEQFAEIAEADGINFKHITYQEVIVALAKNAYEGNKAYCDYLTDRYL